MADGYYRATVTIPTDTGLPQDAVQNVWSFRCLATADHGADGAEIAGRLNSFYVSNAGYLSSAMTPAGSRITIVDLAEDRPRVPFYDEAHDFGASTTTAADLPAEVAVCLSFRGAIVSGVNARRRRGRIYFGPIQLTAGDQWTLPSGIRQDLIDDAVADIGVTTGGVEWCVYSPYTHHDVPVGQKLDPDVYPEVPINLVTAFTPVVHVWSDNAFDIQRRRGPAPTSRLSADI